MPAHHPLPGARPLLCHVAHSNPVTYRCGPGNHTQFKPFQYRRVAKDLDIGLSRSVYRHPGGSGFIERIFRTLKE